MRLKSLQIHGFKSFPDKTVLNFGEGITAVVGPNGSGKSNIADAVKWVLGEQSTKSLRGAKMEDVIFGGTQLRKAQGFAEVTLCIDNSNRKLGFDDDEVLVTRRYYRSGESEYKLNNTTVRLKDIHELFMDTGLGRDGYSIIGQGKIADIVSSKSQERREIFEEAAGISKYRYRKIDAERRLVKAEDNLLRLRDILAELEERVGPLKEQSEKAKIFIELENERKDLEIGVWLDTIDRSRAALREEKHKIELAESQREDAATEFERIEGEIEQISAKVREITVAIDEIRRKASEDEENAVKVEGEIAVLHNTVEHNEGLINRLKGDITDTRNSGQQVAFEGAMLDSQIAELQKSVEELNTELRQKESQLYSLTDEQNKYSSEISELREFSLKKANELSNVKVASASLRSTADELLKRSETLKASIEEKQSQKKTLSAENEELSKDIKENTEKLTSCQNSLKGYEMKVKSKEEKWLAEKSKSEELEAKRNEKLQKAHLLTELENNLEGFAHSTKLVIKESQQGRLKGICGAVSRLIHTESKYSVAIEVALGNALQNIITETEADAKRAIEFLKREKAGRTTFLPISNIKSRHLGEKDVEDEAGFVGIASELVSCDKKYLSIAENLLGKTVVAEDLDSATAIGKRFGYRFKIVTLDGQMVNAGGSLTGGSLSKSAGLFSRSSTIDSLKAEAKKISDDIEKLSESVAAKYEEFSFAQSEYQACNSELMTAREDLIRLESEDKRISFALAELNADLKSLEGELLTASQNIEKCEKEATEKDAAASIIESEIAKADEKIRVASGSDDELKQQRDSIAEIIATVKLKIFECEKDIQNKEEYKNDLLKREDLSSEKISAIEEEIAQLEAKNKNILEAVEQKKLLIESLRNNSAKSGDEIKSQIAHRDELETKLSQLRIAEREKAVEGERISGEIERLIEHKDSIIREYDSIIEKLYNEYELTLSEAEQKAVKIEDIKLANRRLNELKSKIRSLGSVNVAAIEEYKEVSKRYEFMKEQMDDVERSKAELTRLIDDLTNSMKTLFEERFVEINQNFKTVFNELFGGGSGELRLSEPDNVLESGIDMIIQPPGKKVQNIDLFSGGEKALTAISLYFAILRVNPAPFCVLDEIEAALDDVNVDRFASYLRKMCQRTQFIAITHRRGTMEEADMLYGVTMQEKGVSKLLSLNISEIAKKTGLKI